MRGEFMNGHLHVRSCYSLLKSTMTINKIVESVKLHGHTYVALCDQLIMHATMDFFHACKNNNIKAIIGLEILCNYENENLCLILYAKDDLGYKDLIKLSTYISCNEKANRLSLKEVSEYARHCIVTTGGDRDILESFLIREEKQEIQHLLSECEQLFSDFYVAISRNDSELLKSKNLILKNIAHSLNIKCFALSRIYYQNKEDEESYQALCAIGQGLCMYDKMLDFSVKRYYRSATEMQDLYDDEELITCEEIAHMCCVEMKFEKAILPKFENKYGVESEEFLLELCHKGLAKRINSRNIPQVYVDRLHYELDIINQMHYADYFLIVWDFIRFAKSKSIYIGPGRGSAAGSLVSYCLGITHADPIQYQLIFERFLNPERISMPDIDTDFPDNRRDEVIAYVKERYGAQRVAHIITFNTLAAKQVLRDVGKILNIELRQIDSICKMVPNFVKISLEQTYQTVEKFRNEINKSEKLKQLFTIAKQLEGLPRHASLHAAGIIFSNDAIVNVCPLIDVDEGVSASQFTMEYLEELGLIKMDFLGLRNLTIIDEVVQHIRNDNDRTFDIMRIKMDDKKAFQLIQAVDTIGIFQLESEGMKTLIRKMKPNCFEDIVATIALFRPGPMENIPEYLARRNDPKRVDYIHESLKPILKNTYGIMIYQEQILQIAQKMAGFTLGKADNLRQAISKKKGNELAKLEKDFIIGAIEQGYEQELAKKVYLLIMKFANYGFNRSHSVAYGMIAYQMAYLKANAPLYFYASLLNSVIGSDRKTSEYIFEARKNGTKVMLPSVNQSMNVYMIEDGALRYPFLGIKGIGAAISLPIMEEREGHGVFLDFFDFIARMSGHRMGKKTFEILIYAGALDVFKLSRSSMIASLNDALRYGDLVRIEDVDQIVFDFDLVSKPSIVLMKDYEQQRIEKEKEVIGFYISTHPIERKRNEYNAQLQPIIKIQDFHGYVKFVCMIEHVKQHRTKHGDLMLFALASDETMKIDLVCMPNIFKQYTEELVKGNYLYIEGKIDKENSCLVRKIEDLSNKNEREN